MQALRARLDAAATAQENLLASIASDELGAQRQRIADYEVQARFALAAIYDRAAEGAHPQAAPANRLCSGRHAMNMRRTARVSLLTLLLALAPLTGFAADAANGQAAPTLKDLPKKKVEIRKDTPSDANAAKAIQNYRQFLELKDVDPALQAEALRRLGDLSLEGGELERADAEVSRVDPGGAEAIRLYTQLLKAHPDYVHNDRVLYQLARAYETTGQPEKALAALDEVVHRYPGSPRIVEVQFRRGELLFSARRYRDAEAAYAEVTKWGVGEYYQQGLYKQGWSLFKQNLNEESLALFARLLDGAAARRQGGARVPRPGIAGPRRPRTGRGHLAGDEPDLLQPGWHRAAERLRDPARQSALRAAAVLEAGRSCMWRSSATRTPPAPIAPSWRAHPTMKPRRC